MGGIKFPVTVHYTYRGFTVLIVAIWQLECDVTDKRVCQIVCLNCSKNKYSIALNRPCRDICVVLLRNGKIKTL